MGYGGHVLGLGYSFGSIKISINSCISDETKGGKHT